MKRLLFAATALLALGVWPSTATANDEEYEKLYKATVEVMEKYFHVRPGRKSASRVVAESRISTRGGSKTRVRVQARIVKDAEGFYDVEVRATNQVEISEPNNIGSYQSRYQWQSVNFDRDLEAKLVNEIKDKAFGAKQPIRTKFMNKGLGSPEGKKYQPSRLVFPEKSATPGKATKYVPPNRPSLIRIIIIPKRRVRQETIDQLVLGEQEFRNGNYAKAATLFRQALMSDPHPAVEFALGHALFATGHYGFASAALREGMNEFPQWPGAKLRAQQFYGQAKDFTAQRQRLEQWLAKHPDDKQAKFLLAYVCYFGGELDRAKQIFAELLAADANDAAARDFINACKLSLDASVPRIKLVGQSARPVEPRKAPPQ